MSRFLVLIGVTVSLLAPLSASAMQTQTFEFADGKINASWAGLGPIQVQKAPQGIVLSTGAGTGEFLTTATLTGTAEAGTLRMSAQSDQDFYVGWIFSDDPRQNIYTIPLTAPRGDDERVSFRLRAEELWQPARVGKFGLILPPNTVVMLHSIELHRWNVLEHVWSRVVSFWKFDEYRPYSINFVWGPQLAGNSVETEAMYRYLPPQTLSATIAAYVALIVLIALLYAYAHVFRHPEEKRAWVLRRALLAMAVLWLLFDARMGGEFLSWVAHDQATYIGKPQGERTLRERESFYDFAEYATQFLGDRTSYIFFADHEWPYLGNMRYVTYPAIPGITIDTDDTWVIYNRPDLTVTDGRITIDGEPVSAPGTLLGRFDEKSFVFRTSAPPAPQQ